MEFISRDFSELTKKQRMKIVKGSVIPRPIAWISSLNDDGSVNLAPFSYFNMFSSTILAAAFQRAGGRQKDTARNLLREREAVVHIPDRSVIGQVDDSSEPLPPNMSEVDKIGLTPVPGSLIRTPGIAEARIRLEVEFEQHIPLMNYEGDAVEADLILMRVRMAHIRGDIYDEENEYVLHEALDPLARLGGPLYSGIDPLTDFTRKF